MDLKDRVTVVTGGASGLGRATVEVFVDKAAAVDLLCSDLGDPALAVKVDVADPEAVSAAMATVDAAFGRVDICVNAAGVPSSGKILNIARALRLEEFSRPVSVNLICAFDRTGGTRRGR